MSVHSQIIDRYDGITEILHVEADGSFHVEYVNDLQTLKDHTARAKNEKFGYGMKEEMRPIGELDHVTIMRWQKEGINIFDRNCDKAIKRKLKEEPIFSLQTTRTHSGIIIAGGR